MYHSWGICPPDQGNKNDRPCQTTHYLYYYITIKIDPDKELMNWYEESATYCILPPIYFRHHHQMKDILNYYHIVISHALLKYPADSNQRKLHSKKEHDQSVYLSTFSVIFWI